MARQILMVILAAVLGFAVICQGTPAAYSGTGPISGKTKPRCKCCVAFPVSRPAPPCCTTAPAAPRAPLAPASGPGRGVNERLVLPALVAMLAFVPRPAVSEPFASPSSHFFLSSSAVPIFQRDCTYLI